MSEELERLHELHQNGALSDEEYAAAKAKVLADHPSPPAPPAAPAPVDLERETRQWAMFLHLSLLAGLVVPMAGLVLPIVIWQVKKGQLPGIDVHGRHAVNWILSEIIYGVVSAVLIFVIVGIPMLIALGVLALVFPILAGLKANEGRVWKYPLAISFLK